MLQGKRRKKKEERIERVESASGRHFRKKGEKKEEKRGKIIEPCALGEGGSRRKCVLNVRIEEL